MLSDLLLKSRAYRRFDESVKIPYETLRELIDATRYCPSAANRQPLKYHLVHDANDNARVFECLKFAAYLEGWAGPADGERPTPVESYPFYAPMAGGSAGRTPGRHHRGGQCPAGKKVDPIQPRNHHDPGSRRPQGLCLRVLPEE